MGDMNLDVAKHVQETGDQLATYGARPLTHGNAAAMMDAQNVVSGYRLVSLRDYGAMTDLQFAALLTDAPLQDIEREAAWALGDSVLVYIKGVMARERQG